MNILVVDDEVSFRLLMKSILTSEGHEVHLAEDGEEAVEKVDEIPLDLIISDIYMPVMDGFKLHKAIRSSPKWQRLPMLFVSAYDDQHSLDVIQDPKIDAFVKKGRPFNEIKDWISYLTAPDDEKPSRIPGSPLGKRPGTR